LKITVQKFGGSSLANSEQRDRVCHLVKKTLASGSSVVIVVSAMGRRQDPYATDTLIQLVKDVNPHVSPREMDIIMSCGEIVSGVVLTAQLNSAGIPARFLTG
jgi:aspartate kinase